MLRVGIENIRGDYIEQAFNLFGLCSFTKQRSMEDTISPILLHAKKEHSAGYEEFKKVLSQQHAQVQKEWSEIFRDVEIFVMVAPYLESEKLLELREYFIKYALNNNDDKILEKIDDFMPLTEQEIRSLFYVNKMNLFLAFRYVVENGYEKDSEWTSNQRAVVEYLRKENLKITTMEDRNGGSSLYVNQVEFPDKKPVFARQSNTVEESVQYHKSEEYAWQLDTEISRFINRKVQNNSIHIYKDPMTDSKYHFYCIDYTPSKQFLKILEIIRNLDIEAFQEMAPTISAKDINRIKKAFIEHAVVNKDPKLIGQIDKISPLDRDDLDACAGIYVYSNDTDHAPDETIDRTASVKLAGDKANAALAGDHDFA